MRSKIRNWLAIVALGLVVTNVCSCRDDEPVTVAVDDNPAVLLDSLENRLAWVDQRLAQESWSRLAEGTADSLAFFRSLQAELLGSGVYYEGLKDAASKLSDEVDQRRLHLLLPKLASAQLDRSELVRPLYDSLSRFYETEWCRRDGRLISASEAERTLTYGRRVDREGSFRALSSPGEAVVNQIGMLIRLRNQAAKRLGYNDYISFVARSNDVDASDIPDILAQIDSLTAPTYERMLSELRTSFGSDQFELWDWNNRFANSLNEGNALFPAASQETLLRSAIEGLGFDLERTPIYFRLEEEPGGGPPLALIRVNTPHDLRLAGQLQDGFDGFVDLISHTAEALHATAIDQEGWLLCRMGDEAWSGWTRSFFEAACTDPLWLEQKAGLSTAAAERFQRARSGTHLLKTRELLVMARFEYEAYHNPNRDLNELYWDLYEQYTGLPKHEDLTPWASHSELLTKPLAFYHRLLGEAAGAQTWQYVNQTYDLVVDNAEIGAFLKHNFFRFGQRYPWTDLLERATGEKLTPAYLAARF